MTFAAASRRFVVGLEGPGLCASERRLLSRRPPFGVVLYGRNLESPGQAADLVAEVRGLADPPSLVFLDQEGGSVDRVGPLLGVAFPSAEACAARGSQAVHDAAYLMGRAARLLGVDVDLAPVVDLAQPGAGAAVLAGRCFGFHAEDVVVAGSVFLHGLARAGVASCLKHFPGLGRGAVDAHVAQPLVDVHDVDLMVTDVAPFARLCRSAEAVMVGHGGYPDLLGSPAPASLHPAAYTLLRERLGFGGVVLTDDLSMGALLGPLAERAERAAAAGADALIAAAAGTDAVEEAVDRVAAAGREDPGRAGRLAALAKRCAEAPRPRFGGEAWSTLAAEARAFVEELARPRRRRDETEGWGL